ncbi:MAG: tetratricopeptide repeat protein [Candidatus Levybacteria bacterium]|nr:tetratricopeptide repeat protein [Candidatus Levybacteria bacterium]
MNDAVREQWALYLEKASAIILGILFVLFPLVFTDLLTDLFILPKQAFLAFGVLVLMILYGVRTFFTQNLRIKRTPFDLPVLLFIGSVILSVVFSVAKYDSLFNFIPLLFAGISFFAITYNTRDQKSLNFLTACLLAGGALISILTAFTFLKVYVFPMEATKFQTFTPLGSILDQALYLGLLLPLGGYFLYPLVKKGRNAIFTSTKEDPLSVVGFSVLTFLILVGLSISIYELIVLQKPLILPLATGFQTAFAAISQDGGRVIQGFLFGSGYGQFATVFLRFKQAIFNTNPDIWNLTFFRSSTYVLELLSTTGLLGFLSFLFIVLRVIRQRPLFVPLLLIVILSFVLPFAFYHVALLFFMLGIYSVLKSLHNHQDYFDVELQLVASKKGFFVLSSEEVSAKSSQEKYGKILASIVLVVIGIFALIFGFLSYDFTVANATFQRSLVAASQNNGQQTYDFQSNALNSLSGRYVDAYHRVFAQTNLALANSLATSIPQGSSPSAQTTQTINTLVQQSINSGRTATSISPNSAVNWQNLSSIYRALIGFGQNADSFAILAAQQAIQLDPTNPQEYINLGGLYYQIKAWDRALEQFQIAINLKPDLPNAYYNHAHAFIEKGDLASGLEDLKAVKELVKSDKENTKKIDEEIKQLEEAIKQGGGNQVVQQEQQPQQVLPTQNPKVEIPGPTASVTPTQTPTPTPVPSGTISPSISPSPTSSASAPPHP